MTTKRTIAGKPVEFKTEPTVFAMVMSGYKDSDFDSNGILTNQKSCSIGSYSVLYNPDKDDFDIFEEDNLTRGFNPINEDDFIKNLKKVFKSLVISYSIK